MSINKLAAEVESYNNQLTEVSLALQNSKVSSDDKKQLEELQLNLIQLLELSLDQLKHLQEQENVGSKNNVDSGEDDLDRQMALFQDEIAELTGDSGNNPSSSEEENLSSFNSTADTNNKLIPQTTNFSSTSIAITTNDILDVRKLLLRNEESFVRTWSDSEVLLLEGEAVRAPFTEEWGGHTYHNGVVMSTECDEQCPMARVLFSQPTSVSMIPCKFYLSDCCRFSDEDCQYSHGHAVCVTDLRVYSQPSLGSLEEGSRVLCQHSSGSLIARGQKSDRALLWHPGLVEAVLHPKISVDCTLCKKVVECDVEKVVALVDKSSRENPDEELEDSPEQLRDSTDPLPLSKQEEEEPPIPPQPCLLGGTLGGSFGAWQKHTKGIGSLLLQRMGYTPGKGLGKEGEGRVDPVPAYLYPPGVSLDRCMELRERAGGENMMQVEKKLLREQAKEEKRQKREEEKISKGTVFDLINNKLAGGGSSCQKVKKGQQSGTSAGELGKDTVKALNFKSYQLSSQKSQLEKDIQKLQQSKLRNCGDKSSLDVISEKIKQKKLELNNVEMAAQRVGSEQQARKDTKKYINF